MIAHLAERQHGVVTLAQLESLGLGKQAVAKRAKQGRLHRVHRGVYAVGRPGLTRHGRWMAAVLAYGPPTRPDFLWRRERLVAETDGRGVHTTARAFESDRLRDQRLTVAGCTVVRFTRRQVVREPRRVAAGLRRLLARLARP